MRCGPLALVQWVRAWAGEHIYKGDTSSSDGSANRRTATLPTCGEHARASPALQPKAACMHAMQVHASVSRGGGGVPLALYQRWCSEPQLQERLSSHREASTSTATPAEGRQPRQWRQQQQQWQQQQQVHPPPCSRTFSSQARGLAPQLSRPPKQQQQQQQQQQARGGVPRPPALGGRLDSGAQGEWIDGRRRPADAHQPGPRGRQTWRQWRQLRQALKRNGLSKNRPPCPHKLAGAVARLGGTVQRAGAERAGADVGLAYQQEMLGLARVCLRAFEHASDAAAAAGRAAAVGAAVVEGGRGGERARSDAAVAAMSAYRALDLAKVRRSVDGADAGRFAASLVTAARRAASAVAASFDDLAELLPLVVKAGWVAAGVAPPTSFSARWAAVGDKAVAGELAARFGASAPPVSGAAASDLATGRLPEPLMAELCGRLAAQMPAQLEALEEHRAGGEFYANVPPPGSPPKAAAAAAAAAPPPDLRWVCHVAWLHAHGGHTRHTGPLLALVSQHAGDLVPAMDVATLTAMARPLAAAVSAHGPASVDPALLGSLAAEVRRHSHLALSPKLGGPDLRGAEARHSHRRPST
jgi:hypothetical protein